MRDKDVLVSAAVYAQLVASLRGDLRAPYRVGDTLSVRCIGAESVLRLHIAGVDRVPEEGGTVAVGFTLLPVDARWNRLHELAQKELPLIRHAVYRLMTDAHEEIEREERPDE